MSNSSQFVSSSIQQVLLGLARGLRDAQAVLDELPPTDSYGRPRSSYHLPYLDFTIHAAMETSDSADTPAAAAKPALSASAAAMRKVPMLKLKMPALSAAAEPDTSNTTLTSTLSGRLVSVPPSNNLPTLRLLTRVTSEAQSPRIKQVLVNLNNTAGDLITGASIEFNLDLDASVQLSKLAGAPAGLNADKLRSGAHFSQRVAVTDAQGNASIEIKLDQALPASTNLLLLINCGPTMTQLIITP